MNGETITLYRSTVLNNLLQLDRRRAGNASRDTLYYKAPRVQKFGVIGALVRSRVQEVRESTSSPISVPRTPNSHLWPYITCVQYLDEIYFLLSILFYQPSIWLLLRMKRSMQLYPRIFDIQVYYITILNCHILRINDPLNPLREVVQFSRGLRNARKTGRFY